jgi:hypothetical protein
MKFKDMSKRQRAVYLKENVKVSDVTRAYVEKYRTNRCLEFRFDWDQMVDGKLDVNAAQLQELVDEVEKERLFRGVHHGS